VLFGTDCPFDPEGGPLFIREAIRAIDSLGLKEGDRRRIYFGNAIQMLKLDLPVPKAAAAAARPAARTKAQAAVKPKAKAAVKPKAKAAGVSKARPAAAKVKAKARPPARKAKAKAKSKAKGKR
jgi:hypothetical protein